MSSAQTARVRDLREWVIEALLKLAAFSSIAITVGIIAVLVMETVQFFGEVSMWEFLTGREWTPLFSQKKFGVLPLFAGTALTSLIAMAVAAPLGLMSAVYLSEYTGRNVRNTIKPALEILAAVPTVVYGYFALQLVTPALQRFIPGLSGFNALSPGIVMGIMILPIISSLSEDALQAVPASLREGSYALGASRWQMVFSVAIPAAFSGIVSAFLLGVARAVGETMIVAIAAGLQPRLTFNPLVPIETVTSYIVQVSMGDTPTGSLEYKTIFAVGMSLFLVTFILNASGAWMRERFHEVYE